MEINLQDIEETIQDAIEQYELVYPDKKTQLICEIARRLTPEIASSIMAEIDKEGNNARFA
jgi:hypothetical protein